MAEDWLPAQPRPEGAKEHDGTIELLSHDIRSAVSDVVGGLRLIDFSALDPATAAQLQRVSTAGEALARLLDSALRQLGTDGVSEAAARAGAGWAAPGHEPVPLLAVLRNLERRWAGHARERGMALRLDIAADLPTVLHLDAVALDRVLANLLSNAFKYADWGEVTLMVDMRAGDELRFSVRDRGPGFSDAALARLFQRGGRPQGQTRPGSGLGLHIAKELATRLGGQLQVSNGDGGGAEVSLLLPRPAWAWQGEEEDAADLAAPPPLPDLSGLTALVAEDNTTNQLLFTQMLDHLGASWRLAPDGAEALRLLTEGGFDFALVDIDMPKLSGVEVIARTRALPSDQRLLPILAVTAYVLQEHRERIYAAGADGILAKPVHSLAAFGQSIAALMRRTHGIAPEPLESRPADPPGSGSGSGAGPGHASLPAPVSASAVSGPAEPAESDFCRARLERLVAISGSDGGREFLTRLHSDLLRTREALGQAFAEKSQPGIRAHTHVLISLSGALGAQPLQELASLTNAAAHRADTCATAASRGAELDGRLARLIAAIAGEMETRFGEAGH